MPMQRRALLDSRPWLTIGIVLAIGFWLAADGALGGTFKVALKGASVAALAGYALSRSRARAAKMVAAVMAAGAAGDVALELSTVAGGALFLLAHLIAIALYLTNPSEVRSMIQQAAAMALLTGVPLTAWVLTREVTPVIYAAALGGMAASAWLSRFSRYRVGIGALLFVASDVLIFARLGGVLDQGATGWLVWPLYYAAQLLTCTGVIRAVRGDHLA